MLKVGVQDLYQKWSNYRIGEYPTILWYCVACTLCSPQICPYHILYSGKFSHGANFRIFRMCVLHVKIKTKKFE